MGNSICEAENVSNNDNELLKLSDKELLKLSPRTFDQIVGVSLIPTPVSNADRIVGISLVAPVSGGGDSESPPISLRASCLLENEDMFLEPLDLPPSTWRSSLLWIEKAAARDQQRKSNSPLELKDDSERSRYLGSETDKTSAGLSRDMERCCRIHESVIVRGAMKLHHVSGRTLTRECVQNTTEKDPYWNRLGTPSGVCDTLKSWSCLYYVQNHV